MKKIYIFLAAAGMVASASAVEKEMVAKGNPIHSGELVKVQSNAVKATESKFRVEKISTTRAGESGPDYAYFRAADNMGAIGISSNGYFYQSGIVMGFANSYGDMIFNNYSTNVKSNLWNYTSWDLETPLTSNDVDLAVAGQIGEFLPPTLTVTYNSGATANYTVPAREYLCGAGASYWMGEDAEGGSFGTTFYQNYNYAFDGQYTGLLSNKIAYNVKDKGYNSNGVYTDSKSSNGRDWQSLMNSRFEGQTVSNLALDNFTYIQPKPASTYFITQGWPRCNITVKSDTQLLSYIYPIDEDGSISDTPIAIGYAPVSTSSYFPVFDYYPLNEDGDELDGEVYIDSAVAITIEGFLGNDAVQEIMPVCGVYPISYNSYSSGNYDIVKDPTLYLQFSMNVDGEPVSVLTYDNGLYYLDNSGKDQDTLSMPYGIFMTDATYAFIYPAEGEAEVNLPKEGGNIDFGLNALYYVTEDMVNAGYYEIDAPEWVNVTVLEPDRETGVSKINIACTGNEDRSGIVSIKGFGVALDITVNQGAGAGVEVVTDNGVTKFYDLAGRRVVNPEKGIYVKVSGNKSEKVVL